MIWQTKKCIVNDMEQTAQVTDPTGVELRRYDDGKTVVVAGGKEYGPPRYKYDIFRLTHNAVFNDGLPVSVGITVRERETNEMVLTFGTRI